MAYCPDLFRYQRRVSSEVRVGQIPLGGEYPIRVQSMCSTSTMDTEASVAQSKRIIDAGADYVRLTAQGVREAANLALIREALRKDGFQTPLVADIHFNPKAADEAAGSVEKVRINPGNYVDPVKTFAHVEYTDEEYRSELNKIRERFVPFLNRCRSFCTAVRIGVNHGSLSDRIMSRYGDTPAGMVESCMEFLRICVEEHFPDVVISMKASNVLVMVHSVRLLVERMREEDMQFPLHLGVTEAGDGEDGRIKSAAGIGALLIDGIGDTIRVSLSEDPELEIPVARKLLTLVNERVNTAVPTESTTSDNAVLAFPTFNPLIFKRRQTQAVGPFGGDQVPQVLLDVTYLNADFTEKSLKPDFVYVGTAVTKRRDDIPQLCNVEVYNGLPLTYPVYKASQWSDIQHSKSEINFLRVTNADCSEALFEWLKTTRNVVLLLETTRANKVAECRALFHRLMWAACRVPVVLVSSAESESLEDAQLASGLDFGALLLDGFGDGVCRLQSATNAEQRAAIKPEEWVSILFGVLQSTRLRISKTEYISCPSCGRTLFDLQKVIAQIKARTSHLKGLKIGIMGCIVNGPGEMADADYGYVGAGKGQVSLYKGQRCVEKSIPADRALDKLIALIREHGDWVDPD